MKLDLYEANADYIAYLRQFDPNVLTDKTYKQKKFVGTIVTINSKQYFAPLSSPKGKHRLLDSKLDIYKLDSGNLGVINFNKMIPINKSLVEKINFKEVTDKHYNYLLRKQYKFLNERKTVINNRANKVYAMATKKSDLKTFEEKLKERCCNFKLLEEKSALYNY